jgi:2-polyprenyl-3-methyl-5-hydroxy-6-metoxy-1,4-benzoquinol methylase
MTSEQLAAKTDLNERWVREWLRQQSAAGLVSFEDDRFLLGPEAAEIFGREESPLFGAGIFDSVVGLLGTIDGLEESFRTGIGAPYDSYGALTTQGIERTFRPFYRSRLTQEVFPAMDGLVPKLEAGAKIADVGCGAAAALVEMAKVYPSSAFHGFDNSRIALARAHENVREAGVENVTIHDTTHTRLEEDGSYDLITTLD